MCEGCGRSANEVQMSRIETLLIDSAWQTITSATDISVLGAGCHRSGERMSDGSTPHETGSHVLLIIACNVRKCGYCARAQPAESHLASIWCHCLFFHLSAKEVVQTPQMVGLMAAALHINSIHCLRELQLPLTLIKYWYPCKHSCHIEHFIQSHSLPPPPGMSCCSLWEIGPLFLCSLMIYGDKIKCSDTELKLRPNRFPAKVSPSLNKSFFLAGARETRMSWVCGTREAAASSDRLAVAVI